MDSAAVRSGEVCEGEEGEVADFNCIPGLLKIVVYSHALCWQSSHRLFHINLACAAKCHLFS